MRRRLGQQDLVGLGWRTELAHFILSHLDQIDVVEVILDDHLKAPLHKVRALKTLNSQVPVIYHGVGLGLASSFPIDQHRVEKLARLIDAIAPDVWSEHLAFVRAGDIEIGHLAAPPRTSFTVEGALRNLDKIKQVIGTLPTLENVSTLIDPPGSKMPEPLWVGQILKQSGGRLLLDLHNLYSNALNFGFDPVAYLQMFPLEQVELVHLSGGKWIQEPRGFGSRSHGKRLLDDHVHDVPQEVYALLSKLALSVSQPLTVIIERDGDYPEFSSLLRQVQYAKRILINARKQKASWKGDALECAVI